MSQTLAREAGSVPLWLEVPLLPTSSKAMGPFGLCRQLPLGGGCHKQLAVFSVEAGIPPSVTGMTSLDPQQCASVTIERVAIGEGTPHSDPDGGRNSRDHISINNCICPIGHTASSLASGF